MQWRLLLLKEEVVKHTKLQKTIGYRNSSFPQRVELSRKRLKCTLIIQQFYRDQLKQIMGNKLAMQLLAKKRIRASVMIQSYVRQWITHLNKPFSLDTEAGQKGSSREPKCNNCFKIPDGAWSSTRISNNEFCWRLRPHWSSLPGGKESWDATGRKL